MYLRPPSWGRFLAAAVFLFGLATTGCARQETAVTDIAAATKTMQQFLAGSGLTMAQIMYDKSSGLYEVTLGGGEVIYLDSVHRRVLVGDIISLDSKINYNEQSPGAVNHIDFSRLPVDEAVKVKQGKGTVQIAVFTDPDCPYCRKLEQDLQEIDDITVYNFLYPLAGLHPDAPAKAAAVWCRPEKERAAVWTGYMRSGKPIPAAKKCQTPLEALSILGAELGVKGTPFIIFPDGKVIDGYVNKKDFIRLLTNYRK